MEIKGNHFLITGANRGIGRAVAVVAHGQHMALGHGEFRDVQAERNGGTLGAVGLHALLVGGGDLAPDGFCQVYPQTKIKCQSQADPDNRPGRRFPDADFVGT